VTVVFICLCIWDNIHMCHVVHVSGTVFSWWSMSFKGPIFLSKNTLQITTHCPCWLFYLEFFVREIDRDTLIIYQGIWTQLPYYTWRSMTKANDSWPDCEFYIFLFPFMVVGLDIIKYLWLFFSFLNKPHNSWDSD
jgi:hypothetical protein